MKNSVRGRVARHIAMAAATVAAGTASADIIWSGYVNLNIPSTTNGLYLNFANGAYNETGGAGSTVPGWDVNPYSSANLTFYGGSAQTAVGGPQYVRASGTSGVSNLAPGYVIDGSVTWATGSAQTTGANAFVFNSDQNLVGFRFFNEASGTIHYGWMRISLSGTLQAQPRTLVEYAYESNALTAIAAGVVPAPGAIALLGFAGVAGSRRRRD